jgi:hypothetical protein
MNEREALARFLARQGNMIGVTDQEEFDEGLLAADAIMAYLLNRGWSAPATEGSDR